MKNDTTGVPALVRFAGVLAIQRNEALKDQTDAYHVGLYNGMLMICCNVDDAPYYPLDALPKHTPVSWPADPFVPVETALHPAHQMRLLGEESGLTD